MSGVILLPNMNNFITLIKKHALAAVASTNPLEIRYGTVVSASPLKINIDQKMTLEQAHLELTRNVTDYEVQVSINNGIKQSHKVYNALKQGEKVIMLRMQGGKRYIVWDRV